MNAPVTAPALAALKAAPMHVFVKGRIDSARRHESKTYTRITTPAADAYSRPAVVEIRSKARLGAVGEEVQLTAVMGGYTRKPYKATDKENGEISYVTPVDITLDAVEA